MHILFDEDLMKNESFASLDTIYPDVKEDDIATRFAVVQSDESDNPDNTAVVLVRTFIENGARAHKNQKYVVALRFHGFGDMATIDIVSLDKPNHSNIVKDHVRMMQWLISDVESRNDFQEAYMMPVIVVGAHLNVTAANEISFFDNSKDFGGMLLGSNANDIAEHLMSLCNFHGKGNENGEKFLAELINFILIYKSASDFYEIFAQRYIPQKFTGQQFGGLLAMKTLDRAKKEDRSDLMPLFVQEMTDGLGKAFTVMIAANKIRS